MARQSEIKHGRVSVAAFVGYCVQVTSLSVGHDFGWNTPSLPLTSALRNGGMFSHSPNKLQIILFVGFLEFLSELTPGEGSGGGTPTHYTKGSSPVEFHYSDNSSQIFNLFRSPLVFPQRQRLRKKARGLQ
jgi:hypothetical protein